MSENPVLPSFGNHRIDTAANRLNQAFLRLETRLHGNSPQASEGMLQEIELLEHENMRLHQEVQELTQLLEQLDSQLAESQEKLQILMAGDAS